MQLKVFAVHQLHRQPHLVLLLYFDSTAELHNSLSVLRSNRYSSVAVSSAYNTQLDEVCLLQQMTTGMRTIEELKAEVAATQLPQETKEVFYQVLDTADEASLSEKERMRYESNLKAY